MKNKLKIGIVYADAHWPEHDQPSCNIVREVVKDLHPDYLINLGDAASFGSLSFFDKNKPRIKEGKRLWEELEGMYKLNDYLSEFASGHCKLIAHIGNHENRIQHYLDEHPELDGLPNLDIAREYRKRGWKVIPWGEFSHIGKLYFHHGDRKGYQTMYHAKAWAGAGRSVMYAHRHDCQRYTNELLNKEDEFTPNAAFSIGCLGKRTPQWMDNRRNNWSNGFGVFYMRPGGYYNVYLVDIIGGRCMWNGKLYDGR